MSSDAVTLRDMQRKLRLIAILDSAVAAGLSPMPLAQLHTIAYLADALSPVWHLRIVDAQLLKQRDGPISPVLQRDVDLMVGRGVAIASAVRYVPTDDDAWRLDARYSLNPEFGARILDAASAFETHAAHFAFVREVVFAVSGLGASHVESLAAADAAYSDPVVDVGALLDIESRKTTSNRSAEVALRFGDLVSPEVDLASAEKIHLYVRALYERLSNVA
ncbi:MAG: hypothetical protein QOD92_1975 [Acidimicrobiaceae bacterium]|jgi:hypothetical protein